jgi:hypothetical protein
MAEENKRMIMTTVQHQLRSSSQHLEDISTLDVV